MVFLPHALLGPRDRGMMITGEGFHPVLSRRCELGSRFSCSPLECRAPDERRAASRSNLALARGPFSHSQASRARVASTPAIMRQEDQNEIFVRCIKRAVYRHGIRTDRERRGMRRWCIQLRMCGWGLRCGCRSARCCGGSPSSRRSPYGGRSPLIRSRASTPQRSSACTIAPPRRGRRASERPPAGISRAALNFRGGAAQTC